MGQLGFSVASCGHRSRTDDAESHARQEWSVFQAFSKSRAEFIAENDIAATCSAAWWKFAIFMYPCMKYKNLQRVIEQCRCEGILTKLRELEQKQKPKLILKIYQNLKGMDWDSQTTFSAGCC